MEKTTYPYTLLRSIRILLITLISVIILYFLLPRFETLWISMKAEPRAVTARGALHDTEKTNIEIFRQASPSVVYLTTLANAINPWTRDITRIPRGTGSGFIWDRKGHVITNYHVLQGASAIQIHLSDQRTVKAVLVGASADHDIAVLRIPMVSSMPAPINIGTSHDLQVGQAMYAIGNPFGFDQTLTTGVVSALDRSLYNDNGSVIKGLIQTDAAINPGNSGGPLLDSAGRLVGMNTAIYSPSGSFAGIGFAVPIDTVNRIVPHLIKQGSYQKPRLGITINEQFTKRISEELGVNGVAIIDVQHGSAAYDAGLKGAKLVNENVISGDIIITIDGHTIADNEALLNKLEEYTIGDKIEVQYLRNKQKETTSLILE